MQNHVRDERRRGNGVGELLLCGFSLFPALFFAAVEHSGLFRVLNHHLFSAAPRSPVFWLSSYALQNNRILYGYFECEISLCFCYRLLFALFFFFSAMVALFFAQSLHSLFLTVSSVQNTKS